jgi:hypothetical protein
MDYRDEIATALMDNSSREFVQRAIHPEDYPNIPWGENQTATHQMAYGEADGRYYAFPKVVNENGTLRSLNDDQAFDYAMRNKEFIEFDTEEDASMFSEQYKKFWKDQ